MKTIKWQTAKGEKLTDQYSKSHLNSITECYKNFSRNKAIAEAYCLRKMRDENGYDFRILSYNQFCFTCGWQNKEGQHIVSKCNEYQIVNIPF